MGHAHPFLQIASSGALTRAALGFTTVSCASTALANSTAAIAGPRRAWNLRSSQRIWSWARCRHLIYNHLDGGEGTNDQSPALPSGNTYAGAS